MKNINEIVWTKVTYTQNGKNNNSDLLIPPEYTKKCKINTLFYCIAYNTKYCYIKRLQHRLI